ncbi:unnamed protein product [Parnassius apollo]|uniref:(apollo) hypothetical protein n=1 Tax=Parnassius apollo TaxID=110799 RepID=A0A8S3Y1J6_PARAO|nr:unnamed protein product [Parnassius apollo]
MTVSASTSRANESSPEREMRLAADRVRRATSRASQSSSQRELRLTIDREQHVLYREAETASQRELRLTADRERHTLSRESETYTERELRLTADRERHILSRESETFTQYEERLTNDRVHHNIIRSLEDEHEHEQQQESGLEYYNSLRQERLISLSNERLRIENIRSLETDEQREARLTADRFRHSLNDLDVHIEDQSTNSVAWSDKYKSGFAYNLTIDYRLSSVIGDMNVVCSFCNASKWSKESAGFCCSGGKINLPSFEDPPAPLKSPLLGEHVQSKQFLDNIRTYNSAFQMTSFGAQQISEGPFMPTFNF